MKIKLLTCLCVASALSALNAEIKFVNGGTYDSWEAIWGAGVVTTDADGLRLRNGASLTVSDGGNYVVGNFENDSATVNLSSGTISAGDIVFGNGAGQTFKITVGSDGKLVYNGEDTSGSNKRFMIGRHGSTVTMDIDGGVVTNSANTTFEMAGGNAGTTSTVNITNGGTLQKGDGVQMIYNIGSGENSTATINIKDADSKMVVENNGSANNFYLGSGSGSNANINVSDGGTLEFKRDATSDHSMYFGSDSTTAATTAKINVNSGGNLVFTGNSARMGSFNFISRGTSDTGIFVNTGATMTIAGTNSNYFNIGSGASESTFVLDINGGTLRGEATADTHINIGNNGGKGAIIVQNGGQLLQIGSNFQFTVANGANSEGLLHIKDGGVMQLGGNMSVGAGGGVGKVVVEGSTSKLVGKNGALTDQMGDIRLGTGNGGDGTLEVLAGARVTVRGFYMASYDNGTNQKGTLILKGQGSLFDVRSATTIDNAGNYKHIIGRLSTDANASGNLAKIEIWTGAQYRNNQNAILIYDTARIAFKIDGSLAASGGNIAMLSTQDMKVTSKDTFSVDLAGIGFAAEGDYTFTLLEFRTTGKTVILGDDTGSDFITLTVGVSTDAEFLAALKDFISIENGSQAGWDAVTKDNLEFITEGGVSKLVLNMHAVPEPGAWAAIFGLLALAVAAYSRRK